MFLAFFGIIQAIFALTVESYITIINHNNDKKCFLKTVQKKCRRKAAMQVESRRKVFSSIDFGRQRTTELTA